MKKKVDRIAFLALVGLAALSVTARADILIFEGLEGGSGDVQNVLFNDLNSDDISLTVDGFLNQTGEIVTFTGTELLATPSGGQNGIEAAVGSFDSIFFRLEDPTLGFDKVQFNVNAVSDGAINLTFTDQFNTEWSSAFALNGAGQNFFTAIATNDQIITSVTLGTAGLISDLAQVRLNPVPVAGVVPEPATMILVGAGMAGLGFLGSRKRRKE